MNDSARTLASTSAIVTGAAGGIGRELVRTLLDAGARVLATDRDLGQLEALRDGLGADGARLHLHEADLQAEDAPASIVRAAVGVLGEVNAVIGNAGIGRSSYTRDVLGRAPRVWEVPSRAWDEMFGVNALAGIRLANAAIPQLLKAPCARLVFVTTSLDSMLNAGTGPYGPSKAALEAYAAVAADELAGSGVTVNVLIPGGVVDSPMIPDTPGVSRDRMLKPRVMAAPLRYLLSKQASQVTAMRLRANLWDPGLPDEEAARACAAPIAWSGIAKGQRRDPR